MPQADYSSINYDIAEMVGKDLTVAEKTEYFGVDAPSKCWCLGCCQGNGKVGYAFSIKRRLILQLVKTKRTVQADDKEA